MKKVIKDLVHGYIEINQLEEHIINSQHFQRLKDIRQLTCQYVFPTATHNRFEHSLGVMYLSEIAFKNLYKLLCQKPYKIEEAKCNNLLFNLKTAALLHDIGHAPYSHLGEKYYRSFEIKKRIEKIIKEKNLNINIDIFSKGSKHELMSCYIILEEYYEMLSSKDLEFKIDFELICRSIVGNRYSETSQWLKNILITLLNSDTIDTDKLDYLMRDSYMTGITVPLIDVSRLFRNIYINPASKKVTFCTPALPVLQNIIDARDSLYLWVYNHHTVVYTDFVTEFYIKHMILNFEKKHEFADKLDPNQFFSCDAISNLKVSDSDLYVQLKKATIKNGDLLSKYTGELSPQLFERKFLKPLWKTIFEYNEFLRSNIKDDGIIRTLEEKMCSEDYVYRRYLAKKIITECNLNLGQIFIVPRSNKFYSLNSKSIFNVYLRDGDREIGQLLPQKDFSRLYKNVAFYVFGVENKIKEIRDAFIKIASKEIPNKSELMDVTTELEWFKEE